jgi:hypothetical protein
MPRLALVNMLLGFAALFLAAAAGSFIATTMTEGYLRDKAILDEWSLLLQRSAHGHTNLFGMLHVCFGLTMPYSALGARLKKLQTVGLAAGTVAMGPLMLWRAAAGPVEGLDASSAVIGVCLSAALAAIGSHAFGLGLKLARRG